MARKAAEKPATKKPSRTTSAKRRYVKVWHIFHFEQRFELPDDSRFCRKSPLVFTRDFVGSGQDDESICYHQQMISLRASPNYLQLKGAFHELKGIAANRSRCYRGYMLDERLQPASLRKIASWLNVGDKEAARVIRELESAGLVERVDMPRFDPGDNEPPVDEADDSKGKAGGRRAGKKRPHRKVSRSRSSAHVRARDSSSAFKKKDKGKDKSASGNGKDKEKDKTASAAPQPKAEGKENVKSQRKGQEQPKAKAKPKAGLEAGEGAELQTGRGKGSETPSSPTATPPIMPTKPTESDAGVGCLLDETDSNSAGSVINIAEHLERLYEPSAQQFAIEIYQAIGTPHSLDSPQGYRETAAFAAAWQRAQRAGLKPSGLAYLWQISVKEAHAMNRKRKRIHFSKSAEAVWMSVFNKRLDKLKRGQMLAVG